MNPNLGEVTNEMIEPRTKVKMQDKSRGGRAKWGKGGEGRHSSLEAAAQLPRTRPKQHLSYLYHPGVPGLPSIALVRSRFCARHRQDQSSLEPTWSECHPTWADHLAVPWHLPIPRYNAG